jgi:hypothetical protein
MNKRKAVRGLKGLKKLKELSGWMVVQGVRLAGRVREIGLEQKVTEITKKGWGGASAGEGGDHEQAAPRGKITMKRIRGELR